ncbi:MAG: S-layer homology domain-containing protein, partial [Clostridia bacterium]|nr:S-layer homology domain-containing protein [Clostridia bacterium]
MIVTILYRMENSPNNNGKSKFSDVPSTEWYSKAIKWAVDNHIVHGYGGTNKFGPNDNIIRQDLAGILRNYAKYKKKNTNIQSNISKFSDYKKVDSYANSSMQWAVGTGVITGNANGTLNPKGNATRAEAAAMIQKYCQKVGR